ncbi:hypothetical protein F5J12DRAFT_896347 [Pisolithus orientalis]|uniref:uncharacterized protein n=1 Tax=Pisolithus orientalis TaxID=936130 RepID=UPI002224CB35|nr:uncharacterized protein F5J12DRAFT_896347 [Pisolithus orientalis]KAI5996001.1 hypothetical protein F5J12DRAFT_896347 [Pisolithus orientalis]
MSLPQTAASVGGAFDSIPVVDIGCVSTPEERAALAQQIRDACVNVGFFYISNHGIPQETIDEVFSAMKAYFSLPLETKMKVGTTILAPAQSSPHPEKLYHKEVANFKGYTPVLDSNIDPANRGDLHEGFEIGWEELLAKENDEKRVNDGSMSGANAWPLEPAGFREACLGYYHAAVGVGKVLFRLFALALDLPETYFDDKTRNSAANMQFLHYPPQTGSDDDRIIGFGAHTELGFFLKQPGIQALQVLNSETREWINAPPIPGTLVINIADQLARWTNDVFRSTVHRAINRSGVRRHSIPLFFGTDYHVQIEPMPSCVSPERPPKYEPIAAGDYVRKRLEEKYHQNATFS